MCGAQIIEAAKTMQLLLASSHGKDANGSAEGGTEGGGLVVGGAAAIRGRPIKEGMLAKRGHVRKNWQNRHFVITPGFITYFDQPGGQVKGTVRLSESTAVSIVDSGDEDVDRSYQFEVKCDGRDLLMESKSESDMAEWMDAIALAANGAEPEPSEVKGPKELHVGPGACGARARASSPRAGITGAGAGAGDRAGVGAGALAAAAGTGRVTAGGGALDISALAPAPAALS